VCVVDASGENRSLVERLSKRGLDITYCRLDSLAFLTGKAVTKIFIRAITMYSNGFMLADAGAALIASFSDAPVIAFCETYKFSKRVVVDTLTFQGMRTENRVRCLELDVTPAQNISIVVSEVGSIPPVSVPIIIREFH
jgi:translation initiation factor eIF-2B subunit delta